MNRGAAIGLAVAAGLVGFLLVAGTLAVLLVRSVSTSFEVGGGFGDPADFAELAALTEACETGDMIACDDLYFLSRVDSAEERVGETCGQRRADPIGGQCAATYGDTIDDGPLGSAGRARDATIDLPPTRIPTT